MVRKAINGNYVFRRHCEESLLKDKTVELRKIWSYFNGEPHVFLATTDSDQPRVRPVTLVHLRDKLYVTTGSDNAKVRQIEQNPKTEFCLLFEEGERKGTIRTECIARIVKDKKIKADVFSSLSFAEEFWEKPEDPSYTVIELKPIGFEYMKPESIEAIRIEL
jgi:uncharacterized pyridoxamine 5'-phosphate oxidase family protein